MAWERRVALKATRQIGKREGDPGRIPRRIALFSAVFALLLGGVVDVRAGGLRIGKRVEQEIYAPLVPTTKNFRMCFRTDPNGVPVLGLCAEKPREPERLPAARPEGREAPKRPRNRPGSEQ